MLRKPPFGEANVSALIASVIGSIGGLFALGLVPATITRNPQFLVAAPTMNVISFLLCGAIGWIIGGQIGPRLPALVGEKHGHILGGIIGGLIPVLTIAAIGWYLATQPAP